jgi:hypothetical protein
MDSRWDSERSLFLRLRVDFSISPCKLDHSGRPAPCFSAGEISFLVQALHGQKGEQNSCSLVKDLLFKCVIIITLVTHCHWIYFNAKMKHALRTIAVVLYQPPIGLSERVDFCLC